MDRYTGIHAPSGAGGNAVAWCLVVCVWAKVGRYVDNMELMHRQFRQEMQLQDLRLAEFSRALKRNYADDITSGIVKQKLGLSK